MTYNLDELELGFMVEDCEPPANKTDEIKTIAINALSKRSKKRGGFYIRETFWYPEFEVP